MANRTGTDRLTHECPAPGCTAQLPFHILACKPHWASIPGPLKNAITRHWHRGDLDEYLAARQACVDFLEGK